MRKSRTEQPVYEVTIEDCTTQFNGRYRLAKMAIFGFNEDIDRTMQIEAAVRTLNPNAPPYSVRLLRSEEIDELFDPSVPPILSSFHLPDGLSVQITELQLEGHHHSIKN